MLFMSVPFVLRHLRVCSHGPLKSQGRQQRRVLNPCNPSYSPAAVVLGTVRSGPQFRDPREAL
jgi:hypothetical protein